MTVALLLILAGSALHADSDGYFCVGPTYLAYEIKVESDPPAHHLYIVRAAVDGTLRKARRTIPDFQVHGMRCESDVVLLDGWDATYEIDLRHPVDPRIGKHAPGKLRRDYSTTNLAQWNRGAGTSRTQRINIPWGGATLEIVNGPGEGHCRYKVVSRLVGKGEPVILVDREFERDCG